jgi:Outer membrane protein Omp28
MPIQALLSSNNYNLKPERWREKCFVFWIFSKIQKTKHFSFQRSFLYSNYLELYFIFVEKLNKMGNKIWIIVFLLTLNMGCNEIEPTIPPLSTSIGGERKVLIEEFTGVRCVNCPDGSAEIENIRSRYPDRVVAVSTHAGFFSNPYPENRYDFRTLAGTQLQTYLEEPQGYPSAVVNRKKVAGQAGLQVGQLSWASLIEGELRQNPVLKLAFVKNYNPNTRSLDVKVRITPEQNVATNDLRLTVLITESNVADAQLTSNGKKLDYLHQHILRKIVTNFDGNVLENLLTGNIVEKSFQLTLPVAWKSNHCEIIAFVSHSGATKEVLQAGEISVE